MRRLAPVPQEAAELLSYRHAFHAGNHADVLKHVTLCLLLEYMQKKQTALLVADTHAGRGVYPLDDASTQKLREADDGIARLWASGPVPPAIAPYLARVRNVNPHGTLRVYPGSPALIADSLRPQDRAWLFELHPTDSQALDKHFSRRSRQIRVRAEDGLTGLRSILPPPQRRALVFIDPAYEIKTEYDEVIIALTDSLRRFATGVYALWYPVLARPDTGDFGQTLERAMTGNWLHFGLTVRTGTVNGVGMLGSAMMIINPPWTLQASMQQALPWLCEKLKQDEQARFWITQSVS